MFGERQKRQNEMRIADMIFNKIEGYMQEMVDHQFQANTTLDIRALLRLPDGSLIDPQKCGTGDLAAMRKWEAEIRQSVAQELSKPSPLRSWIADGLNAADIQTAVDHGWITYQTKVQDEQVGEPYVSADYENLVEFREKNERYRMTDRELIAKLVTAIEPTKVTDSALQQLPQFSQQNAELLSTARLEKIQVIRAEELGVLTLRSQEGREYGSSEMQVAFNYDRLQQLRRAEPLGAKQLADYLSDTRERMSRTPASANSIEQNSVRSLPDWDLEHAISSGMVTQTEDGMFSIQPLKIQQAQRARHLSQAAAAQQGKSVTMAALLGR